MSKHALSRIYERYVSVLRVREAKGGQLAFDIATPGLVSDRTFGGVYTPQYIARFFVRFLRERIPPYAFKRLITLEPAVGSGIFLRTLLEMQCDPFQDGVTSDVISKSFANAMGLDIDPNATHAARLSLSLLYLVLTGNLPDVLNLQTVESVEFFTNHGELHGTRDVVIANPPFVTVEDQSAEFRHRIKDYMGDYATGRIDTSLAFLKLAIEALRPGGHGLYVMPHSFLIADSAKEMRAHLASTCWIRCVVDLSAVDVFEGTGVYVILLIFQKKTDAEADPSALVVKCKSLVSQALQAAVDDQVEDNPVYQLYRLGQASFAESHWVLTPPKLETINRKIRELPCIDTFMHVKQGFITGADSIFIVDQDEASNLDEELFIPYLSDRKMLPYKVPEATSEYVFYPYRRGAKVTADELARDHPNMWEYLNSHRGKLEQRADVKRAAIQWWQPAWPRQPESLLRPKIVTPHIVLIPRFALDNLGRLGVSHTPYLYPKDKEPETDLLTFFLGILNSAACFRSITEQSHKYSRGYSVLEVTTLKRARVPDPGKVSPTDMREFLRLVDARIHASDPVQQFDLEKSLDEASLSCMA